MAKFESKYDVGQDVILGGITGIITEIHLSLKGYSYNVKRENSVVYQVEESDSNLKPAPKEFFVAEMGGDSEYTPVFNSVEELHFWYRERYNNGSYKIMKLIEIEEE